MHKKGNYSYDYTAVVYYIVCKNQTSFLLGNYTPNTHTATN
jgi:hypothetical protein